MRALSREDLRKLIVIQASGVKACHNREDTRSVTEISE